MTRRRALVLVMLLGLFGWIAAPAIAADSATDKEEGGRHLDIKSVSNKADDEYVTYRVETHDTYDNVNDFSYFRWYFDTNDDGKFADMCIRLEAVGDGRLRAMFYPKCGGESWSTAEAKKVSERVLEFRLPTRDFVVGGGVDPGDPLSYTVASEDIQGRTDIAPDRGSIEHTPIPEPATLYVTAPPDVLGAGSDEEAGGDDTGDASVAGRVGANGSDETATGGATENADGSPVGWILVAALLVVALIAVAILEYRRRAMVAEDRDRADADHADDGAFPVHTPEP